jgi:chromosome segregation ATPase
VSKEQTIRKNFELFEQRVMDKTTDIDFNDLIFKAKRIPVQKYIEYKREIRLSKLKQVDIEANINDMKNLITKAKEELEENKGTGQKCKEEIEQAVKYSKKKLDEERQKKLEVAKFLAENTRKHGEMKNQMAHLDNEIRELRSKNEMMAQNREFLVRISGLDEDPKWTPPEGRRFLECEEVFKDEYANYTLPDLENEEELLKVDVAQVMLTGVHLTFGREITEEQDYNSLNELEQRNNLLQVLKSPVEFMEKLRAIESENLDIIGGSQNIVEEINEIERKIAQYFFSYQGRG